MIQFVFAFALVSADVATSPDPETVPERFRLEWATFQVTVKSKHTLTYSGVEVFAFTFG